MSKVYTVAIVGGGIGRSHIVEGYLPNADKFKLLAICDLDPARMNSLADEFHVERRTTSFDDLLKMDDLDIIDICTPPMVHYPMIMAALKAGKHIICEKPLVGSLAQIDEVMAEEKAQRRHARCRCSSIASATASSRPRRSSTLASPASPMSAPSKPCGVARPTITPSRGAANGRPSSAAS